LLKGEILGLRDEEVCECERYAAETSLHEENVGSEVGIMLFSSDEVRGDNANDLL
jgi:hypothetical protein